MQRWYFGKVCPIESPEGQGIGLVNEFAMGAIVDNSGRVWLAFVMWRHRKPDCEFVS
ncbi:MAG: hypothetical protein ACTS4Y_02060 [Candidatus Hodgkinia cicadicola]